MSRSVVQDVRVLRASRPCDRLRRCPKPCKRSSRTATAAATCRSSLVLPDGGRVPLSSSTETEIVVRTLAGAEGARIAGARAARARLRAQRDRLHRRRPARSSPSPTRWSASVAHGRESVRARWRTFWHQHRSNRQNIAHHYDVSNAFYRLWLDPRMVYSCAYFSAEDDIARRRAGAESSTTSAASCGSRPASRLLDIGCGWGGLVFWAARALRRRGDGHHAVAAPVRARDARDRRARARRAACSVSSSTTSTCPRASSTTRSPASGCSSTSARAAIAKYFGKIYRRAEARAASC